MIRTCCLKTIRFLESLKAIPLLLFRWVMALGFFQAVWEKLHHFDSIVLWFTTLNIPFPKLSAYLAAGTEVCGVICLFFGLLTRIITLPLIFLLCVAIKTVHLVNGFAAMKNGIEIPLYYILMLIALLILGPGGISIDAWIKRRFRT